MISFAHWQKKKKSYPKFEIISPYCYARWQAVSFITAVTNQKHKQVTSYEHRQAGRQAGKPLLFLGAPCQPFFRKSFFTVILSFALCFFGHRTYILSSLVSNILSTTNNKQHQQTTNNKQETTQTNNKQQTTNNEQWTMNNEQDTSRSTTTSTSTTTIIIIDYITEKL